MEENNTELYFDIEDAEDIDADVDAGDVPENDITPPTREEYDSLMSGVFKSFYDSDMQSIKDEAKREAQRLYDEQRDSIIRDANRELLCKIRAKNQRISEIGIMKSHGNAKRRVSDMTKEERALVAKRAASGEIINLK